MRHHGEATLEQEAGKSFSGMISPRSGEAGKAWGSGRSSGRAGLFRGESRAIIRTGGVIPGRAAWRARAAAGPVGSGDASRSRGDGMAPVRGDLRVSSHGHFGTNPVGGWKGNDLPLTGVERKAAPLVTNTRYSV